MKVQELLHLTPGDIATMDRAELATVVTRIASAGNKRLKRIRAAGVESPAYAAIQRSGGAFSVRGKTKDQLIIEYQRARRFFSARTSTVLGARQYLQRRNEETSIFMGKMGVDYDAWSEEEKRDFWRFFDGKSITRTIEAYFGAYRGKEAIRLAQEIWQRSKNRNQATMRRAFRRQAQRKYEESAAREYEDEQDIINSIWGE